MLTLLVTLCITAGVAFFAYIRGNDASEINEREAQTPSADILHDNDYYINNLPSNIDILVMDNDIYYPSSDREHGAFPIAQSSASILPTRPLHGMISTGLSHSLYIRPDGSLWAWGENTYGQLGNGTLTTTFTPVRIGSDLDWVYVSVGTDFSLGIKADGSLWSWGRNNRGQLGDGTGTDRSTPVHIEPETSFMIISNGNGNYSMEPILTELNWIIVAAGEDFSIGLKSDGSLWVWGNFLFGGNSHEINRTPTRIGAELDWVHVSACRNRSYGIRGNSNGRSLYSLGEFNNNYVLNHTLIGWVVINGNPDLIRDWVSISRGGSYMLAIRSDGSLWGWGEKFVRFSHGDVPAINSTEPTRIGTDSDWTNISASDSANSSWAHSLGVRADGTLWAWGNDFGGSLGMGLIAAGFTSPRKVGTDSDWVNVAAADSRSYGIKSDGSLWRWGSSGGNFIHTPEQVIFDTPLIPPTITITTQPTATTTFTAGSITGNLSVAASVTGGVTPTYQWFSNTTNSTVDGTPIVGATGTSISIQTNLSAGTYYYYVVVSAANATSVVSSVATVTVLTATNPDIADTDAVDNALALITANNPIPSISTSGGANGSVNEKTSAVRAFLTVIPGMTAHGVTITVDAPVGAMYNVTVSKGNISETRLISVTNYIDTTSQPPPPSGFSVTIDNNESAGIIGRTRTITVAPPSGGNVNGRFLLVQITEATSGSRPSVVAMKLNATTNIPTVVTLSYQQSGATIDTWLFNTLDDINLVSAILPSILAHSTTR